MLSMTQSGISSIIVLTFLQLVSMKPLSSMFIRLCILISLGYFMTSLTRPTFNNIASVLASEATVSLFLAWIRAPYLDPSHGIATAIALASTDIRSPYSVIIPAFFWTLSHCIVLFLDTSVRVILRVLFRPEPSRCCRCTTRFEHEESPTVVKVEHTRSRDTDSAFTSATQPPNDFCEPRTGSSKASDTSTCTDETDAASSSTQDSADFSFGDPDSSPNSTWHSDATSATLLSDSDICSIAARFNHALVRKRFGVESSIFCTPEPSHQYRLATETGTGTANSDQATNSGSDLVDTFPPLGDLLSPTFSSTSISAQSPAISGMALDISSSCSYFGMSPSPTHASSNFSSVFSTSFIDVARATSGSRSAPVSRRSSFSSTAPLFRPLSLFASSTSSDVSLASTSPSPSRPLSTYRPLMLLPSSNHSSSSSYSSLSDFFLDGPELALDSPSPSSQPISNSAIPPSVSTHTRADVPAPSPWIPASLSAWYLAEGWPVADDSPSGPLRIFGVPAEELSAHSFDLHASDFSAKDEAYLCAALGLHEPTTVPLCGFWTAPWHPRRWHPSRRDWYGWVFPRPERGGHKPTFVPEEIPAQAPYDQEELVFLWTRWGFWPTSTVRPEYTFAKAYSV